ncbi:hypothetical protein L1987_78631 [Smallanthus sonchifolius]|uniref:Uncharacterized protein n=1 Tax=Smallanthus sonchifolius TaxID=185202 RepID=A0ACB8ZCA2_9ASTR|nr:hypothetical protein L1987_78631 [Smallanthus sonchifolius]
MPDGRPWQEVRRRRAGGAAGAGKGRNRREDPRDTTFYVSNLQIGTKSNGLEICFAPYGRVVDTYIAAKRDKSGGLFGFVRFADVTNKWEMGNLVLGLRLVPLNNMSGNRRKCRNLKRRSGGKGNMSYREVLLRSHEPAMVVEVPEDADYDVIEWYDKSVAGKLIDFNQLCCLHQSVIKFREGMLLDEGGESINGNHIPDSYEQSEEKRRNQEDQGVPNEVEATLKMGKELGVNFDNLEEMVRNVIEGELVTEGIQ